MLALHAASLRIGPHHLLQDVSLTVRPGEVRAVVGPNGAGKTSMLRVLTGERSPSTGAVLLDEQPLDAVAPERLARRRAVLPQSSTLTFGFTVEEVVLLGRTPHVTTRARNREVVAHAMDVAGVAHLSRRRYPTLSGGEAQRVQLARALAQIWEPADEGERYLLLDEPTSSLDLAHQHAVLRAAQACAEQGVGVLAVLHDLNLAAQYAHRMTVLHRGRVLAEGTPEQALTPQTIFQAFSITALVVQHPCAACPLVVPVPEAVSLPL